MTISVDKKIEVDAPLSTVYNQWTQFEEFPRFMEGVEEVRQIDDARLFWSAEVGGTHKEWYSRITRQVPDQVLAWESESGAENNGTVTFKPAEDDKTEIDLHVDYEADDFKEAVGGALGFLSRRVEGDLERFKEYIEERGRETGAWRGEIGPHVTDTAGRYGASGQGGSGYGGTAEGGTQPGTPGTPNRPL